MAMCSPKRKALCILVASAMTVWCAAATAREQADIRPLLDAAPAISFVYFRAPPLSITTPAKAAPGGGLITAATHSQQLPEGGEIEKAFGIPDASSEIAAQLAMQLKSTAVASKLHTGDRPQGRIWSENTAVYQGEAQDPFVLELAVDRKAAAYLPFNWRTYYYGISARLRLIDVAQSKVVWERRCNQSGLHGDTYKLKVEQFEADGGARLKEVARAANEFCAHELGALLPAT